MSVQSSTRSAKIGYWGQVYFRDGLAVTFLLISLLYLILAISLDAASYVRDGLGIVAPITLGALAVGGLMSFSRFDSFFAFSHSMFTGLAWILFLMARHVRSEDIKPILDKGIPELQARAYFVLVPLLKWVDQALENNAAADNYIFIFSISFLVWWLTFLGVWTILRHGYIWRALIPAGIALLLNTHYAPPNHSVYPFLGAFALVLLLLLVRTNLSEQQLRWREEHTYFSQDIGWDFVRTGIWYSLLVLALALFVPDLGRSPIVRTVLEPATNGWMQVQKAVQDAFPNVNRRTQPGLVSFGNSLELGGERTVGDSLLFDVEASRASYWRAVIYDAYTGRSWKSTSISETAFLAGDLIPVGDWQARTTISQTITLLAPMGTLVLGAPDIRQISLPIQATIAGVPASPQFASAVIEGTETGAVEFAAIRAGRELNTNDRYIIVSNATNVTERALLAVGEDYPQSIVDRYLPLPEDFSARVAATAAEITAGKNTPYEKAKAIESYLRVIPYNDAIAAPAANQDPVEYFLYDIRQGYCDYYATAMAVMLRSVGVPARVVSGYAVGTFDEESRRYYVTERDAHTWVEVFFPQLGWVEFEPTASETAIERPFDENQTNATLSQDESNAEAPSGPTSPLSAPNDGADTQQLSQFEEPVQENLVIATANTLPWWLWLILTPILAIAGIWLIRRFQLAGPASFTYDLAPILYERIQRWAAWLRLPAPQSFTPYEQSRQLTRALPEAKEPIATITQAYVRHQFAPRPQATTTLPSEERSELLTAWNKLSPVFWKRWLSLLTLWRPGQQPPRFGLTQAERRRRSRS